MAVTLGVLLSVAVKVMLGVSVMLAVAVTVTVPVVGEGLGLLFFTRVALGGKDGVALGVGVCVRVCVALGVALGAPTAAAEGKPEPIKMIKMPTKSSRLMPLKIMPWAVGRNFKAKSVSKPSILANAKWTIKTKIPCGKMPGTPEPRPNPPALMGK